MARPSRRPSCTRAMRSVVNHFQSKGSDARRPGTPGELADPDSGDGHRIVPPALAAPGGQRDPLRRRRPPAGPRRGLRGRRRAPRPGPALQPRDSGEHHGLRTQAPTNTGAGWYSLTTGAWAGGHGSTNNTFHVNGQPFANRTGSFNPGVLQAETIAQAAERGGKKVAQIEWAGGRNGVIQGPTVDFRTFLSGRGVATNYIGPRATRPSSRPSG